MPVAYYKSENRDFTLLKGDCIELLNSFDFKFDMIFADPPYHLSNGGISVQNGKMVSVNKGDWDKDRRRGRSIARWCQPGPSRRARRYAGPRGISSNSE